MSRKGERRKNSRMIGDFDYKRQGSSVYILPIGEVHRPHGKLSRKVARESHQVRSPL